MRRKAIVALGIGIVGEALVRCAREANEKQHVAFLIATRQIHAGRFFAHGPGHGLADQAFRPAGILVAFMHGQEFSHLGNIDAFVAEEFDVPDAIARE